MRLCLCMYLPVTVAPLPPPPPPSLSLSHCCFPPRIMAFVVLSLILSWASLGAGTATAVVRKHCLLKKKKSFFKIFSPLFIYLFIYVCLCLIGPSGSLTVQLVLLFNLQGWTQRHPGGRDGFLVFSVPCNYFPRVLLSISKCSWTCLLVRECLFV